jgi:pimeloyl-ACP methyl ester carboxylesterase
MVMTGDDDPVVRSANSSVLAEQIAGAEILVFPGGRHAFNVEFEEESNGAVIDFVRRHSSIAK